MNEKLALQENHEPFGFSQLVQSIQSVDGQLRIQTARAVNVSVTIRNWLIGCYIREFEQVGVDRAAYGERLIEKLSATLSKLKVSRVEQRDLRRYRQFYLAYPHIRQSLTAEFLKALPGKVFGNSFYPDDWDVGMDLSYQTWRRINFRSP